MPALSQVNQLHIYLKLLVHNSLVNQKQNGMFIYYYSTCICTTSFIVSTTWKSSSCAEHLNQHSVPLTLSDTLYDMCMLFATCRYLFFLTISILIVYQVALYAAIAYIQGVPENQNSVEC